MRISGHRKGLPEPLTPTTRSHNLIDRVKEKIKSMTRRKNTIRGATHHVHVCKCALVWCCREAECAHRGNIYSDDPKFPKDNPNCERCGTKDSGEPNANTPSDYLIHHAFTPAAPSVAEGGEKHEYIPTQLHDNAPCAWADHPDAIGDARYYCGKPPSDPIHVTRDAPSPVDAEKQARTRDLAQDIVIESSKAAGYADSTWLDVRFKHELTSRITTALISSNLEAQ